MGIQLPESYYQQPYQQIASYNPYQDQPIEEKSSLEKTFEPFLESTRQVQIIANSILPNNYQIQYPYSNFQVQPQQEEPLNLEKNMKFMIQSQNDCIQSLMDRLQSLNRLEPLLRILPTRHIITLTNLVCQIDLIQPSVPDWSYPNQYMPQSQYYEQEWDNHHHSSPSQWGTTPPSLTINSLTNK